MIKIGILGDIGSGKSFVAKKFGYPVFNADLEVDKFIEFLDKGHEVISRKESLEPPIWSLFIFYLNKDL